MRGNFLAVAVLVAVGSSGPPLVANCIEVVPTLQCLDVATATYDLELSVHSLASFTLEYAFILGDPTLPPNIGFSLTPQESLGLAADQTLILHATVFGAFPGQELSLFLSLHDADLGECCAVALDLTFPGCGTPSLIRGDCNADGNFNIADPISLLGYLFSQGVTPVCFDACDCNDDGQANIADAICTLSVLFGGAAPPPAPYPGCGTDPTNDQLSCLDFPPCS
ncbi:MAG: hypothetical protein AB7O52_16925 [Planctomycetota bacterium]